jgi:hypothetical protein
MTPDATLSETVPIMVLIGSAWPGRIASLLGLYCVLVVAGCSSSTVAAETSPGSTLSGAITSSGASGGNCAVYAGAAGRTPASLTYFGSITGTPSSMVIMEIRPWVDATTVFPESDPAGPGTNVSVQSVDRPGTIWVSSGGSVTIHTRGPDKVTGSIDARLKLRFGAPGSARYTANWECRIVVPSPSASS